MQRVSETMFLTIHENIKLIQQYLQATVQFSYYLGNLLFPQTAVKRIPDVVSFEFYECCMVGYNVC